MTPNIRAYNPAIISLKGHYLPLKNHDHFNGSRLHGLAISMSHQGIPMNEWVAGVGARSDYDVGISGRYVALASEQEPYKKYQYPHTLKRGITRALNGFAKQAIDEYGTVIWLHSGFALYSEAGLIRDSIEKQSLSMPHLHHFLELGTLATLMGGGRYFSLSDYLPTEAYQGLTLLGQARAQTQVVTARLPNLLQPMIREDKRLYEQPPVVNPYLWRGLQQLNQ